MRIQLRVHVVRGGFGHGGSVLGAIRVQLLTPTSTPLGERFGAEIRAPAPAGHVDFDWRIQRVDADFAVAAEDNGLHVQDFKLFSRTSSVRRCRNHRASKEAPCDRCAQS